MDVDLARRGGHRILVEGGPAAAAGGTGPLGHEALLTLARKVQAAASDADPHRMLQATEEFTQALDRHLRDEARALGRVVPAQARILRKGQRRISTLAAELVLASSQGCRPSPGGCESRVEELVALLTLQARDERHAWISYPTAEVGGR